MGSSTESKQSTEVARVTDDNDRIVKRWVLHQLTKSIESLRKLSVSVVAKIFDP